MKLKVAFVGDVIVRVVQNAVLTTGVGHGVDDVVAFMQGEARGHQGKKSNKDDDNLHCSVHFHTHCIVLSVDL